MQYRYIFNSSTTKRHVNVQSWFNVVFLSSFKCTKPQQEVRKSFGLARPLVITLQYTVHFVASTMVVPVIDPLAGHHQSMSTNNHDGADSNSPSHIAMTGHYFSAEDIQDLLGGVLGEHPGGSDAHSLGGGGDSSDHKALARTERKRSREKQRRSEVNKRFTELTDVLRRIEGEVEETRALAPILYSPNNRADLIARTVSLLNSLHESNKRRKQEISSLQEDLQQAKKAGEDTAAKLKESMMAPQNVGGNKVLMMVPMMIGGDNGATPAMGWGAGQGAMPFMMPNVAAANSEPQRSTYTQAPTATPDVAAAAMVANPWGMMPPWMMQHMVMPTAMAAVATSSSTANGDQKAASDDSAAAGSNLAHCA